MVRKDNYEKNTPDYIVGLSRELRKSQTSAEQRLWQYLRGNRLKGYKFRRQYALGRYIADFYCGEARLVIELDGNIHETEEQKEYDKIREEEIKARNIPILRFTNIQIEKDIHDVLHKIHSEIVKLLSK